MAKQINLAALREFAVRKINNHSTADEERLASALFDLVEQGGHVFAMLLWCPECSKRHIDEGEFATKPHHTHACQYCGHVWRPAIAPTVGVRFLPGFKNEEPSRG